MEIKEKFSLSDEELLDIKGGLGGDGTIIVNCTKENSGYFEKGESNSK